MHEPGSASYNVGMTSTDKPSVPTVTPIAETMLGSLATRDFDRLASVFEPDISLNAVLPDGFHEWHGSERVTAAFVRWFGRVDECELVDAASGFFGPRLQMYWRARVRGGSFGDRDFVVEQNVYADPGPTGRIQAMSMLCSGFVAEHGDD